MAEKTPRTMLVTIETTEVVMGVTEIFECKTDRCCKFQKKKHSRAVFPDVGAKYHDRIRTMFALFVDM